MQNTDHLINRFKTILKPAWNLKRHSSMGRKSTTPVMIFKSKYNICLQNNSSDALCYAIGYTIFCKIHSHFLKVDASGDEKTLKREFTDRGAASDLGAVRKREQDWVTNLATINRDYCVCFSSARRKKRNSFLSVHCQQKKKSMHPWWDRGNLFHSESVA